MPSVLLTLISPYYSPLSQYDLPSSLSTAPLCFTSSISASSSPTFPATPSRPMLASPMPTPLEMSDEMTRGNPTLDYTTPDLVSLVVSDLGVMTPSVRQLLLSILFKIFLSCVHYFSLAYLFFQCREYQILYLQCMEESSSQVDCEICMQFLNGSQIAPICPHRWLFPRYVFP